MSPRGCRTGGVLPLVLLALLAVSSGSLLFAADVAIVIAAPVKPASAGQPASFWMNVLNPDPGPARFAFPGRLDALLQSAGRTVPVVLESADGGSASVVMVPPGGFLRREYRLDVPVWANGTVVLEFSGIGAGSVAFEALVPPAPGTAASSSPSTASQPTPAAAPVSAVTAASKTNGFHPIEYFKTHIFPYEPMYFIAGFDSPNAKFQISFKYQLLDDEGAVARALPGVSHLFAAYTQTSLWDLSAPSAPFFDSSYKPELLYAWRDVRWGRSWPAGFRLDLEGGLQHESNGKDGADSRSLNIVYFRPRFVFGADDSFQLSLAPKVWLYVGDLTNNPDLPFYRGYVELRAIAGWEKCVQVSAGLRAGNTFERGSLSLDVSYPLRELTGHTFSGYLYVQYFTGYGESLLEYNKSSETIRFGFALYR